MSDLVPVKVLPKDVFENEVFFSRNPESLRDISSSVMKSTWFLSFNSGGFKKIESSILLHFSIESLI